MTQLPTTPHDDADRHWAVVSLAARQAAERRRAATWVGLALMRAGSALIASGPGHRGRATPLGCET